MPYDAYVFDAYGTLFDVHSAVRRHAAALGRDAAAFSETWRTKQLEYSWVRTLAGAYADFWQLTEQALDFAFARFPSADSGLRPALLDAYRMLDCYPEVPRVLSRLRETGAKVAILSNGSPAMLNDAVSSAGLERVFDAVLSIDSVRRFKTAPEAYGLVEQSLGVRPASVSFQSSNRWDIAGASRFGFRTVWINRTHQPDEYPDLPPAAVLPDLEGLLAAT